MNGHEEHEGAQRWPGELFTEHRNRVEDGELVALNRSVGQRPQDREAERGHGGGREVGVGH